MPNLMGLLIPSPFSPDTTVYQLMCLAKAWGTEPDHFFDKDDTYIATAIEILEKAHRE